MCMHNSRLLLYASSKHSPNYLLLQCTAFFFHCFFSLSEPSWNVYKDFIWNLPFNLCVYLTKCTENSTQPTSVVTTNAHVHWDSNHSHACNWSESYEQICSYLRKQPQTRKIVLLHFIRAPVEEKKVNTNEWNIFHIIASLKLAKEYKTGQKLSHFCCCSLHEEKKTILACHFMRISKQLKKNRLNSINRFRYFSLSLSLISDDCDLFLPWLESAPVFCLLNNIWPINLLMFQVFLFKITANQFFQIMKLFIHNETGQLKTLWAQLLNELWFQRR